MIRENRKSPGSLQAIASLKRAASSCMAHLGDHENISVQQVCLLFAFQFACTNSHLDADFKAVAFIDEK
jgi:hypothetical protein